MEIVLAIVLGTAFGFVLQRIGAADPDKIIGMLRLTDLHLMKTILTGIGVSSILLFLGMAIGLIDSAHLSIKDMYPGVLVGGAVLGFGWALAGFCPGTGVVGAGSGRRDALFFLAGGLAGAALFMMMFPWLEGLDLFQSMLGGKATLAATGVSETVVKGLNGTVLAAIIGFVMVVVARLLPGSLRA